MVTEVASPPHRRFFYGWVIVAAMSAVGALSMTFATLNFGVFIRPMGDELGIGRAVFGWCQTARMAGSGLTSPWIGGLIDRFGSRILLALAALSAGLSLIAMALIQAPWQMVAIFGVMGLMALGGPAGNLMTTVPVAKWFVRRRGRALSLVSVGPFVGGVIFVPVTQLFISQWGWRGAWIALAALGAGLIIPMALIFVRRQPEDMGLAPDGLPLASSEEGSPATPRQGRPALSYEEASWTLAQARRSPVFWRLTAAFVLAMFALGAIGLHRIPNFMDKGLDPGLVALAMSLDAAAGGVSTFAMGFMAERISARFLGFGAFLVLTGAMVLTIVGDTPLLLFLAMGTFGVGVGGMMLLQSYLWAEYFGRASLGRILGFVTPITLIFSGLAGPLAGYVRDRTGSYDPIWWPSVGLLVLAAAIILFTPKPRKPGPSLQS
ncbi:MAG: MFS transporter [Chloroflexi bacterium]|nr:MFS transporter [Chloroflexota bacterium]